VQYQTFDTQASYKIMFIQCQKLFLVSNWLTCLGMPITVDTARQDKV